MSGPNLAAEMYFAHLALDLASTAWHWLERQGVTHPARLKAGNVGVVEIETTTEGFYQPAPGGRHAFIQPVYGAVRPPEVPIMDPADPTPIDLIAWCPKAPARWWLRRGVAILLGEIEAVHGEVYGEPIRVYRTPLDWLRAGGAGIVILANPADAFPYLRGIKIVAEDVAHGLELERCLRPPEPELPRILIEQDVAA